MTSSREMIDEAEDLIDDRPEVFENMKQQNDHLRKCTQATALLEAVIFNHEAKIEERVEAFIVMVYHFGDEGLEPLRRMRDGIRFLDEKKEKVRAVEFVSAVAMCQDETLPYTSIERLRCACQLYDLGLISESYACMEFIAKNDLFLVDHRVDACRYLFSSENENLKSTAQAILLEIIEMQGLDPEYRYKIIAGYISRTGIATMLNSKINIAYDERFVCGLQTAFFYNDGNDPRCKILSGQHLLQMRVDGDVEKDGTVVTDGVITKEFKLNICQALLEISKDSDLDNDVRADAADVLHRLGLDDYPSTARDVITQLGYSDVFAARKDGSKSLLSRAKTIYNNSQNVHNARIEEGVEKFIAKMTLSKEPILEYSSVRAEVISHIKRICSNLSSTTNPGASAAAAAGGEEEETNRLRELKNKKNRTAALRCINRIDTDTATFSVTRATISEILVRVWMKICSYPPERKSLLINRLVEELIDSANTCSSGHVARLVNVLSEDEADLKISFKDQLIANIAGRLGAKIRDITDEKLLNSVSVGMMPDASEDDIVVYKKFLEDSYAVIRKDLHKEFVAAGYIREKDFKAWFTEGKDSFI